MKYFLVVGEASGDLHGSNLCKAIVEQDPSAEITGWGGDLMQQHGVTILKHYKELAFMGFAEVLANLRTVLGNLKLCKKQILQFQPDALVLIDYPGFNIRIAKWAKKQGIKIYYYISPQVWAWKSGRAKTLRDNVDKMISILPFEKDFYKKYQFDIDYVGHPLLDAIAGYQPTLELQKSGDNQKILALLPGSRKQEISRLLPVMLSVAKHFEKDYHVIIAGVNHFDESFYRKFGSFSYPVIFGATYDILAQAHAAMVTSGTATLETALFGVPQVVCYKGSAISVTIARAMVKINFISLVNLIASQEIVKELIQKECNETNILRELQQLMDNSPRRNKMEEKYSALKLLLGNSGASKRAAGIIINDLNKND